MHYYKFQIKENAINHKCKIVRLKYEAKTEKLLSKATVYKNLSRATADEHIYFLDRGKKPI